MGQLATGHFDGVGTGTITGSEHGIDKVGRRGTPYHVAGAPVNGGAGTFFGVAAKYSLLIRDDTGVYHMNTGTQASPTWTIITGTP